MGLAWAVHSCPSTAVNQDFTGLPWEFLGKYWFHLRETLPQCPASFVSVGVWFLRYHCVN